MSLLTKVARRTIGYVNTERLTRMRARRSAPDPGVGPFRTPSPLLAPQVRMTTYRVAGQHLFFGYYDKCPQSEDTTKILAGATRGLQSPGASQSPMTIGYFQTGDPGRFHPLAETQTWCWQQGCMLSWLPRHASRLLVYNCMVEGAFGSRVLDVASGKVVAEAPWPVYNISSTGEQALSCSFSRLHRLRRGYGYPQLPDGRAGVDAPDDEGVWLCDFKTSARSLLHSLRDLARISPQDSMAGAAHYINHLQFNDLGDRFLFIHLWVKAGRQYSRLFTSSLDGKSLHLISPNFSSHYCWKSSDRVVVYAADRQGKLSFKEFSDRTQDYNLLFPDLTLPDGHCTFSPSGDTFLTDTYPDALGYQHLYLIPKSRRPVRVGSFFHPAAMINDKRCDLHPRWARSGVEVIVDMTENGHRVMARLEVRPLLEAAAA